MIGQGEEEANGEPWLTRNLTPGLLFTTSHSTVTGSICSWEEAALTLMRVISTSCSKGPLGAGQGGWHHAAMTGTFVNRSCRQQAGRSHLPHCHRCQEGMRGWDHGKTTVHLQAASPPLGRDGPAGPQSHLPLALAHCSHQGFPHHPAEVEHKKLLN